MLCNMPPGASGGLGCYEHAVALGAGAEALLGRVEGALAQGSGNSGPVYASACRHVHPNFRRLNSSLTWDWCELFLELDKLA